MTTRKRIQKPCSKAAARAGPAASRSFCSGAPAHSPGGSATRSLGRGGHFPNSMMAVPFPPSTTAATTCLSSPPTRWAHGGSARTSRMPLGRHLRRSPNHQPSAIAPAYSPITASMSALVARSICGEPPASSTCRYSMCTAAATSGLCSLIRSIPKSIRARSNNCP